MLRVKITHSGYDRRDVERDCVAAGLVSEGSTYEHDYPIYGTIDAARIDALRAVAGVVDVEIVGNSTGETPFDGTPRLNPH